MCSHGYFRQADGLNGETYFCVTVSDTEHGTEKRSKNVQCDGNSSVSKELHVPVTAAAKHHQDTRGKLPQRLNRKIVEVASSVVV